MARFSANTDCLKVTAIAAVIVAAMLPVLTGCSKNGTGEMKRIFGGPAQVTLVVSGSSSAQSKASVDEENTVRSIRIYVFKHAPGESQNDELAGYGYFTGLQGAGPHYCTMSLSASGEMDFYVLANDDCMDTETTLDETATRVTLEGLRFNGLKADASYMPMSNISTGSTVDGNNFTFTVEQSSLPPLIPIDVTRAMARMSLLMAKSSEGTSVSITGATLKQGASEAGVFSATGAPDGFNTNASVPVFVEGNNGHEISTVNTSGVLDEQYLEIIGNDAYILPNTSGSSDPDSFVAETGSDENEAYILTLTYEIDGTEYSKDIYLPSVKPNDWVKIEGIFPEYTENVRFHILALPWYSREMDIEFN